MVYVDSLAGDPEIGEGILLAFFPRFLRREGFELGERRLRIDRDNLKDKFKPDYRLLLDGVKIGVVDSETKGPDVDYIFSSDSDCLISIPRWTMAYHQGNTDYQRETNKVLAFRQWPAGSFWVGVRSDFKRVAVIHAKTVLTAPIVERRRGNFARPLTLFNVSRRDVCFADIATTDAENFILKKLRAEGLL